MKFLMFVTILALVSIFFSLVNASSIATDCAAVHSEKLENKVIKGTLSNNYVCEICLNLTTEGEKYVNCGQEYVTNKLSNECNRFGDENQLFYICHSMVLQVVAEIFKDSKENPSDICSTILKTSCQY
uniref:Saposin B-type domain-containing protein n=1 Tax=Parastrongyloides trichosuri TaxID=131310 RepID=A0A0N4ZI46_PARTI